MAWSTGAWLVRRSRRLAITWRSSAWAKISDLERHRFAAASYNACAGDISRARRAHIRAAIWSTTATCLRQITGRHAFETTTYVERIWRW